MNEALQFVVYLCAFFAAACWLLSVLTKEYSWVDRIWSVTPVVYVVYFAWRAGFDDQRLNVMSVLVALWGARLTYNFWRKGGYKPGGEDYRWVEVKKNTGELGFQALNATFIAPFQNALLLLIALPAFIAYQYTSTPLNTIDFVAAGLFFVFFVGETVADQQQWRFHQDKHARQARGEVVEIPFLKTGLFRYSRHPNFFCEQAMWWSFYLFSVAASGQWLNWTLVGAVLLSLLFQASTGLTEKITVGKYPDYARYQQTTSRLMPWFPKAAS